MYILFLVFYLIRHVSADGLHADDAAIINILLSRWRTKLPNGYELGKVQCPKASGGRLGTFKEHLMVHCNEAGRVTRLTFSQLNLRVDEHETAAVPSAVRHLTRLEVLEIIHNPLLRGTIPDVLGRIESLKEVAIAANPLLSGTLPSSIARLPNIWRLSIAQNPLLTGSIPSEWASPSLRVLELYENALSGTVPSTLGSLSALHTLSLFRNNLSGALPSELGIVDLKRCLLTKASTNPADNGSARNRFCCPLPPNIDSDCFAKDGGSRTFHLECVEAPECNVSEDNVDAANKADL